MPLRQAQPRFHRQRNSTLLAVLCGLALLAACSSRYSAEPPDYIAAQFSERPPEDGTITLYPTNGPYGGTPAVDFAQVGDTVVAATRLGLYRSEDAGETWKRAPGQLDAPIVGLASLPQSLIAAASPDLYRSDDKGDSWQRITPESAKCSVLNRHSMAVVGSQLYMVCDSLLFVSGDSGSSWQSEQLIRASGPEITELFAADNTLFGVAPNWDSFWRIENWPPRLQNQPIGDGQGADFIDIVSWNGTFVAVSPGRLLPLGGYGGRPRIAPEGLRILSAAATEEVLLFATNGGLYSSDLIKDWGPAEFEGESVDLVKALGGVIYASTSLGIHVQDSRGRGWTPLGIHVQNSRGGGWTHSNDGIVGRVGKVQSTTGSVLALASNWLFETKDLGQSWQVTRPAEIGGRLAANVAVYGDRVIFWTADWAVVRDSSTSTWSAITFPSPDMSQREGPGLSSAFSGVLCGDSIYITQRLFLGGEQKMPWMVPAKAARSDDGGLSWQELPDIPFDGFVKLTCLATSDGDPALVGYGGKEGIVRSIDLGETWQDLNTSSLLNPNITALFAANTTLYAGGDRGALSEINLNNIEAGWSLVGAKPTIGNITALWIDSGSLRENVPQVIVAGTSTGLYITDGGVENFQKVETSSLPIDFKEVTSLDYTGGHLLVATDTGVYYGVDKISRPWPENMSAYVIWSLVGIGMFISFLYARMGERRKKAQETEQRQAEEERQKTVRAEVEGARNAMRHVLQLPDEGFERPGIKVAHHLCQSTTVSGDFYNIIPRSDGSVGIYLVDIEGHGLVAAQKAQDVHRVLSDTSLDWGKGEAREQLEIADRRIREQLGDRNIAVTMNFTEIDPQQKVIRYANAGMPTPLLFHAGEAEPEPLRAAGVYVGAGYSRHPAKPERAELSYRDGDILVLYSDGITESLDLQGKMFERRGIMNAVTATRTGTAEDISSAILKAVSTHAGSDEPQDDQTLIVVRLGDQAEAAQVGEPEPVRITNHPDGSLEASLLDVVGVYAEVDKTLKPAVFDWLMRHGSSQERSRFIWNPVWEAVLNGLWHGSDPGDEVYFYARIKEPGQLEIDLRQPNLWRDWDRFLGDQRRKLVTESEELMIQGTTVILRGTESVSVSNHGRQIVLRFRLSGPSDTLSS